MTTYTSFLVFLFFAIALIVPSGFSYGAVLLVLGSLVLLRKGTKPDLNKEDRILIAVLALYFLIGAVSNLVHGATVREYDLPLRFVLAVSALLLMLAYPPTPKYFWAGLAIGGISSGLFAGYQNLVLGNLRAGGFTNPIQYGDISILLGVLCFAGLGWASSQTRRELWLGLLIAGGVMGMLGSLFTGSRSTWMSLPVVAYILYRYYGGTINKRYLAGIFAALAVLGVSIYMIPRTGVKAGTELAASETMNYFKKGDATTSLGIRIEMWRAGLMVLPEHPLLGFGKNGFVERETELIKNGVLNASIKDNNHVYNEWLDAAVKRGILGLVGVLILYFFPLFLFARHLKRGSESARPYALAGVLLIVNYIGFGLTQAFMTHNIGVMMLGFTMVILWALMRRNDDKSVHLG